MTKSNVKRFELDLGDNPKKLTFMTIDEVIDHFQLEFDLWSSAFEPLKNNRLTIEENIKTRQLNAARDILNVAKNHGDLSNEARQRIDQAADKYKSLAALHGGSIKGKLILKLISDGESEQDYRKALFFLGHLTGQQFNVTANRQLDPNYIFLVAAIAENSWKLDKKHPPVGPILESIEELKSDWTKELSEQNERYDDAVRTIESAKSDIQELHKDQRKNYSELLEKIKNDFTRLKELYETDMVTKAPVTYWEEKAEIHGKRQKNFGRAFAGLIFALGIGSFIIGGQIFDSLSIPEGGSTLDLNAVLQRVLIFIVPFFLAVWLLRVIVRVYLINVALEDDAKERIAMVKTFRSLLEHENRVDETDRILMLSALFRPTTIPGSGDDAAPPNWFDVLLQRIK